MDIEHYIEIEQSLQDILNVDIISIIFEYLHLNYNCLQNNHIRHNRDLSILTTIHLREQFHIDYHIEFEIFLIVDHLEHWEYPTFVSQHYNCCSFIDIYFDINYHNYLWELLEVPEPEIIDYCDL